jgi:hypothetical protein
LKSGSGLNLSHGFINPRSPSTRCRDRLECIVRRIPRLLVGLQKGGAFFYTLALADRGSDL